MANFIIFSKRMWPNQLFPKIWPNEAKRIGGVIGRLSWADLDKLHYMANGF